MHIQNGQKLEMLKATPISYIANGQIFEGAIYGYIANMHVYKGPESPSD